MPIDLSTIIAFLLTVAVGGILGLIGGGGLLLFPINHFVLGQPIQIASAHAACLVAVAGLIGVIPRIRQGDIDWPTVFALGIPVSAGMLLVRLWLINIIPPVLFSQGGFEVTRQQVILVPFSALLFLSFASMRGLVGKNIEPKSEMRAENPARYYFLLIVLGLLIGIVPGFAGAGGGVLIVPTLVVLFGLPMKTVVGTSLAIVTVKSLVGFVGGDIPSISSQIDFRLLGYFSIAMIIGSLIGSRLANRLDGEKLKHYFAWLVLGLAIYIPVKAIFFPN